ncbi:MAG TPA: acyl-CoA dehydrogenase family protein, partial [Polyangium sp.]|nr:acyl-CoA dehydrogenase family protein [Polyangium sp.]
MNFDITDEQRRTQQAAREFAERVLVPKADDVDRLGKIEPETIAQLGEAGWLGKTIPEAHGGADGDFVGLVLVLEELAAACANTAALVATNVVVARALLKYGTEEQKNKLLPLIARGQTTVAHAGVEPFEMLALTRHEDGTCELNGKLAAMDVFGLPGHVLVFGYDDSAQTARAFVLPYTAQNLTATVLPGTLGKRGMGLATLPFDRVRVPQAMMIGEEG